MDIPSYHVGPLYRKETSRQTSAQMGRLLQRTGRSTMVQRGKRQKKVETTRGTFARNSFRRRDSNPDRWFYVLSALTTELCRIYSIESNVSPLVFFPLWPDAKFDIYVDIERIPDLTGEQSDGITVCETWTLTLREEHRLRVFENKVLRKIFGAKRDEITGEWRKLHNAELHALYSSPDIIRNIKTRRLRWAGHVARMGESRNAYRLKAEHDNEQGITRLLGGQRDVRPVLNKKYINNQERLLAVVQKYEEYKDGGQMDIYLRAIVYTLKFNPSENCAKTDSEDDHKEKKDLVGSLAEKKLPTEGCTGRNGELEKSSGQKKNQMIEDIKICGSYEVASIKQDEKICVTAFMYWSLRWIRHYVALISIAKSSWDLQGGQLIESVSCLVRGLRGEGRRRSFPSISARVTVDYRRAMCIKWPRHSAVTNAWTRTSTRSVHLMFFPCSLMSDRHKEGQTSDRGLDDGEHHHKTTDEIKTLTMGKYLSRSQDWKIVHEEKTNPETDQKDKNKLAVPLAKKELPNERCTGRNGEREKSSEQKKISDDKQH
ncbi:hypothetical protein ANN_05039 [Periplaneta americana]|uniref:Uncharacterized protein n=1 Tax=Periplaneta americana TaxID=6978 RepID=A0ABQ8TBN4_PERAM|nr:hypothetical protein ANN_05039 [Periplaneta americana]